MKGRKRKTERERREGKKTSERERNKQKVTRREKQVAGLVFLQQTLVSAEQERIRALKLVGWSILI
jgi:hypothetical protein